MVYSEYIKLRILYLHYKLGYYPAAIARALDEEVLRATREGVAKILKRYKRTGDVKLHTLGIVYCYD